MRIGFVTSTADGNPLRTGLWRGMKTLGHECVEKTQGCDLILIFNHTTHHPIYTYPDLALGMTPCAFIDSSEYGYFSRLPGTAERYWNTFTKDSMLHDSKSFIEQDRLKKVLEGRSFPYFIREFHKEIEFPPAYHPIDYPLHIGSECDIEPNREEYLARELDLFVSWGHSHPWRKHITPLLQNCGVKSLIQHEHKRLSQLEYFEQMRKARCTVSFDGYGSSSFRLTEALQRCLLLQGPMTMRRHRPLANGVTCLEWSIKSNGEEFISSNVCEVLKLATNSPETAFKIYEAGYHHCNQFYSERATAEYVLKVIERHDWSKPTKLTLD